MENPLWLEIGLFDLKISLTPIFLIRMTSKRVDVLVTAI
jgi:hypothetical protein